MPTHWPLVPCLPGVIRRFSLNLATLVSLAVLTTAALAADDPDANWLTGFHAPGMDGIAQAFCEYQGELVVGGSFHTIGTQVIDHIARWDGTTWRPLGAGVNGPVTQLAVCRGEVVAAGVFTGAGGVPAACIARWDGVTWRPLGDGLNSTPECLTVYRDTLFVGGAFVRAGQISVKGIARWDGAAWQNGMDMGGGTGEKVTNLTVAGNRLFGVWVPPPPEDCCTEWVSYPAVWTGANWAPLPGGNQPPWIRPKRLAVLGDTLYASGWCIGSRGVRADGHYIARWTGTEWLPLGREWPDDAGIPLGHDGALYLARTAGLYRWTGQEWTIASRPASADFGALFSGRDGIYVGGRRLVDGSLTAHGIARWDSVAWHGVGDQQGNGLNLWLGAPQVVLAAAGDGFIAGGTFLRAADLVAPSLAWWDGYFWQALPSGPRVFRANAFLDVQDRLVTVEDEDFGSGCRVLTFDGSHWRDIAWFPDRVLSITAWRSRLVVGGAFAPQHIRTAPQLITNPDEVPEPLGAGLNGPVRSTCLFEGFVVASGDFTATADNSVPLGRVGFFDGAAWQPMGDGLPASAITLEPFAGGVAAAMGDGVFHWKGTDWVRLGEAFDGPVDALAVFEGELIAGGSFVHMGPVRLGGLARWREGIWQPVGSGMNGAVQDLLVNGEEFRASGAFTAAGTVPSSGIAAWRELRAGVESLNARVQRDSVLLSWRDPESTTHRFTVLRWSPHLYPADPHDGLAFPPGDDGRFPATPGTVHPLRAALPLDGGRAFFSVFAVHDDGRNSAPRRVMVRLPDRMPPAITLEVRPFAGSPLRLDVVLRCGEPLDSSIVAARLDSMRVRLTQANRAGTLWTGSAWILAPGSSRLTACAHDSAGNEACAEWSAAVAPARPSAAGQCALPGSRLTVEWPAGAFVSEGQVAVTGDIDSELPTYWVVAGESPRVPMAVSFLVRPGDPAGIDPLRIGVLGPDGSVQGGVIAAAAGRLTIRTTALGVYRLVLAGEDLNTLADPGFLAIAPPAPNPFRSGTTLGIELRSRQRVRVTVHDIGGRTVAVLLDAMAGPGLETVSWDGRWRETPEAQGRGIPGSSRNEGTGGGRALPSGVYFARVQSERTNQIVRLVKVH